MERSVCSRTRLAQIKGKNRNELKDIFVRVRKVFDREVQRTKRRYWAQLQNEMVNSVDENPQEFRKTIGRTGVADNRNQKIPFEVNMDDGSISTDPKIILGYWKQDFEQMYNLQVPCNNEIDLQVFDNCNQDYAAATFVVQLLLRKFIVQSLD